jgi:hypothetical protein
MKELRFRAADGEWRAAFAFDTKRKAILLVAGDKSGGAKSGSTASRSARQMSVLTRILLG